MNGTRLFSAMLWAALFSIALSVHLLFPWWLTMFTTVFLTDFAGNIAIIANKGERE